jgi:hypothetical protein
MPVPSTYDFSICLSELILKIYADIDSPDAAITRQALQKWREQKEKEVKER